MNNLHILLVIHQSMFAVIIVINHLGKYGFIYFLNIYEFCLKRLQGWAIFVAKNTLYESNL